MKALFKRLFMSRPERKLLKQYKIEYGVEKIMERWITKRILDGQTERRKELSEKQARLREIEKFIEFLIK